MTTPKTDTIRYPRWTGELRTGDVFQECVCGCILLYAEVWYLNPCSEHEWKVFKSED